MELANLKSDNQKIVSAVPIQRKNYYVNQPPLVPKQLKSQVVREEVAWSAV
jgi:nitrate reductase cytochrome c-type subunit